MKKIVLCCIFAFVAAFAAAQSEVVVAGDNVCLRLRPNEQLKLTGSQFPHLYTGDKLKCVGQSGSYYKVVYDGNYYYLPKKYARPRGVTNNSSAVTSVSYDYIVIAGDNVCLRSQPNEQSKLTGSSYKHFNTGDYVKCVGIVKNYYKVSYNGRYYYIPKKYGRPRY